MIKIPCPRCGTRSQVVFTGDGEIHAVTRARTYERIPEPSIN
jgi:sarcosine oxidase delta subunit